MNTLAEDDWRLLLKNVSNGNCTPFLGAGACYGTLPLGGDIAREWAREYGYPFEDDGDLIRVAQYVAVSTDPQTPKDLILEKFKDVGPPKFKEPDEPHRVLARLPLPVYITTNYDDFMVKALTFAQKAPRRDLCRWNSFTQNEPSVFDQDPDYKPHPATPLVFHLHGHSRAESLVLTEDDYLRFLVTMAGEGKELLPRSVRDALDRNALLFIGYRLADWNFRALLQLLRPDPQRRSYVVMPPLRGPGPNQDKAQSYLEKYYAQAGLRVCWATAREFCGELGKRWKALEDAP